jgi:hypothetical protein
VLMLVLSSTGAIVHASEPDTALTEIRLLPRNVPRALQEQQKKRRIQFNAPFRNARRNAGQGIVNISRLSHSSCSTSWNVSDVKSLLLGWLTYPPFLLLLLLLVLVLVPSPCPPPPSVYRVSILQRVRIRRPC